MISSCMIQSPMLICTFLVPDVAGSIESTPSGAAMVMCGMEGDDLYGPVGVFLVLVPLR